MRKTALETFKLRVEKLSHQKETDMQDHSVNKMPRQISSISEPKQLPKYEQHVDRLSSELIGYIADKWTLLVFEEIAEHGTMRFGELRKAVPGISQKMLTQTLRQMERIGLISRQIYPVIPPRVEYRRTELGTSLGPVICGLWNWVESNAETMEQARIKFDHADTVTTGG